MTLAFAKALDTTTASKYYNSLPFRVIRKYIYTGIEEKLMDWQEHNMTRGGH